MGQTRSLTLQEILRKRQESEFVGRADELRSMQTNLTLSPDDEDRHFVVNIFGQGGVGKTTLVRQFMERARRSGAITASVGREGVQSVPEAMARLAEQLGEAGAPFSEFDKQYRLYRQKRHELEADPDMPQGMSSLLGRSVAKVGLGLAEQLPGAGPVIGLIDKDAVATQAGEFTRWVATRLKNTDEVRLILDPVEVLTPLFLGGLGQAAAACQVVLCFDTYERTRDYLDGWLRDVLTGVHGPVPASLLLVIAGRNELDADEWSPFSGLIARVPLDPFTEDEARAYLRLRGITREDVVETILRLSGRLPLLVATLAVKGPDQVDELADPAGTAVERFLKWVDDPHEREAVLNAALPRSFNQDILGWLAECAHAPADTHALFEWLKTLPFVGEVDHRWAYHPVVRDLILRHKRYQSPQSWSDLHRCLAAGYARVQAELGLDDQRGPADTGWQTHALEAVYHRLCSAPHQQLTPALNGFLQFLPQRPTFAGRWARVVQQAGEDSEAPAVETWGNRMLKLVNALGEDAGEQAIDLFTQFIDEVPDLGASERAAAFDARGWLHFRAERDDLALADIEQALALAPNVAEYLTDCGLALARQHRNEEARAHLDRALEADPRYARALGVRSEVLVNLGQLAPALADLETATRLDPKNPIWLSGQLAILLQQADFAGVSRVATAISAGLPELARLLQVAARRAPEELRSTLRQNALQRGAHPVLAQWVADRMLAALARDEDLDKATRMLQSEVVALGGLQHLQAGDRETAARSFTDALGLDPDAMNYLLSRAEVYRQLGRHNEALEDLDRALEVLPDLPPALRSRASTLYTLNQFDEALANIDRALELEPDSAAATLVRGQTLLAVGRVEEALAEFTRGAQLEPNNPLWMSARGGALLRQAQVPGATTDVARVLEAQEAIAQQASTFVRQMQIVLRTSPATFRAGIEASLTPLVGPRLANASIDKLVAALASDDLSVAERIILAEPHGSHAAIHLDNGEFELATVELTTALDLDPAEPRYWCMRGTCQARLNHADQALADFGRALELLPCFTEVLLERSRLYAALGRTAEAVQDLDTLLASEPDNATALLERGELARLSARYEAALVDLNYLIEIDPHNAVALGTRGQVQNSLGRKQEALAELGRALELDPSLTWARSDHAVLAWSLGRFAEAAASLTWLLDATADTSGLLDLIGDAYLRCAQVQEAEEVFWQRVAQQPDTALHARVSLGVLARQRGDRAAAEEQFTTALASANADDATGPTLHEKAIALLCLSQPDAALEMLDQAARLEDDDDEPTAVYLYHVLQSAPDPPQRLAEARAVAEGLAAAVMARTNGAG